MASIAIKRHCLQTRRKWIYTYTLIYIVIWFCRPRCGFMAQFTCPHPSPRIKYTSPSAPLIHTRLLIASELDKQFEAYYFTRAMRQQQPEWRDGPSTMTPARIAEIFQVNLWEPSNKEPVPKLSQKNFLSLFYYAGWLEYSFNPSSSTSPPYQWKSKEKGLFFFSFSFFLFFFFLKGGMEFQFSGTNFLKPTAV